MLLLFSQKTYELRFLTFIEAGAIHEPKPLILSWLYSALTSVQISRYTKKKINFLKKYKICLAKNF